MYVRQGNKSEEQTLTVLENWNLNCRKQIKI